LHFYAVIEFPQYFVFSIVFALSAFVLAAVFCDLICPRICLFLARDFASFFACHSLRVRNVDENFMRKICVQALCKTPNQIQDEAEVFAVSFASHVMFDEKSA
jgi:hypothetical protein